MDNLKMRGEDILQSSFEQFQDGYKERITGYEEFVLETGELGKPLSGCI